MRYLLEPESIDDLLSLPTEDPLLIGEFLLNNRILEGDGKELAELSLKVEAESLSPPELTRGLGVGFLKDELEPPLSDNLPYSPNFRGGGIRERAGDVR